MLIDIEDLSVAALPVGRPASEKYHADAAQLEATAETDSVKPSTVSRGACEAAGPPGWAGGEAQVRRQLLLWFSLHRRRLPWRGDPPPWCVDKASLRKAASEGGEQRPITQSFGRRLRRAATPLTIDLTEPPHPSAAPSHTSDAVLGSSAPPHEDKTHSGFRTTPLTAWANTAAKHEPICDASRLCTAYGTWVSEVMLQQTQVERVVDYWTRWMEKFPTVHDLARASLDEVNAAWAGLGYYGRGRRLLEGAKYVVNQFGGQLPCDIAGLRHIPGIGRYTAGAIASITCGLRTPVVDGNVIRVFARLLALPGHAADVSLVEQCWGLADALVDPVSPGTFNQALMELGATICTPKAPACARCPLQTSCRASRLVAQGHLSTVTVFPAPPPPKRQTRRIFAAAVVLDGNGRVLLSRRPPKGLLAGQWELPSAQLQVNVHGGEEPSSSGRGQKRRGDAARIHPLSSMDWPAGVDRETARQMLGRLIRDELHVRPPPALVEADTEPVQHAFSHELHTLCLFRGQLPPRSCGEVASSPLKESTEAAPRETRWMHPADAGTSGVTSGVWKVLAAMGLVSASRSTQSIPQVPEASKRVRGSIRTEPWQLRREGQRPSEAA